MFTQGSIEAHLPTADFELPDHPHIGQDVKVAVYCAKADARQCFPHGVIELVRGRMRPEPPEFIENHRTLPRHAAVFVLRHFRPP